MGYIPGRMPLRLAPLFALLFAGCGGGPSLTGHVYRDAEARYRVGELSASFVRLELGQNDLAWHSEDLEALVQVNATCDPFQDVPLTSLTNHLLIGFTDREWRAQRTVPLDGREALRSHVRARLDGVARELVLVVLKKDQCTYDFALIAAPGEHFDAARTAFEAFVVGFTTEVP